jgi:ABC-type multidrug transport system fused ATPase/permease subunit
MENFKKIKFFLTSQEQKRGAFLLCMTLIMAMLDMLGVASIMPLMAVLTNPELIESNSLLQTMFKVSFIFGVENNEQFLTALGIFFFIILISSLAFKAFTTYLLFSFAQMTQFSISKRLVENYLHQPFSWFLNRNSAELGKTILSEVSLVVGNGLKPMMTLIAQSLVVIALLILLILVDPKLALIVFFTFSLAYGFIYKISRSYLNKIGKERFLNNQKRFATVSEAFGAAKEIKVGGLEQTYINRFEVPAKAYAKHEISSQIIRQLPRFALEAVAFGGMLLVILYFMSQGGKFAAALPVLALYALAGYRLMPALQHIYASITQLRYASPAIESLYLDLKNIKKINIDQDESLLSFDKSITLNHIHFQYPQASRTALKDIFLTIPARTTVGLVGTTGSGKTTIVDVILGLLEVQKGKLEVDDIEINKNNCKAWQRSIGYVPQFIYLADDTVAANIAFGVDPEKINQKAIERAAEIANLHEFVISELPEKYQTTVGERGIRLSGGQRQRIGIARALYHNPKLLILDEATSALDNLTEKAVMEAVHNLGNDITIILIAHRLSTVKKCDTIFLLENGQLKEQGTFDKLIQVNKEFKKTANL